jgi:hypothetical protein
MNFKQELYIGFSKISTSLPDIFIDHKQVDLIGSYAGSYHIAEMGNQFREYLQHDNYFPQLLGLPTFPLWSPYKRLDRKVRAPVITGNIGESIAGTIATSTLGISAGDIGHLKVLSKTRTPDFLLYQLAVAGNVFSTNSIIASSALPDWLPMEAKATTNRFSKFVIRDALKQIATYWYKILTGYEQGVGYGVVLATKLHPPEIRIYLFLPIGSKEQKKLTAYLRRFRTYNNYKRTVESRLDKIGRYLLNYG